MSIKLVLATLALVGCGTSTAPKPTPADPPSAAERAPTAPPAAKPAPDAAVVKLEQELADIDKRATATIASGSAATTDETLAALRATVTELEKARADLFERAKTMRLGLREVEIEDDYLRQDMFYRLERIERDLTELDPKLRAATLDVESRWTDVNRANAKAKLTELRKEQAEMNARIKAAKPKKP